MNHYLKKILPFFPKAFIYEENEIIVEPKNNVYFRIDNISSTSEFDCKVLEYLARPSHKGMSNYWQSYFLRGLNSYFNQIWSKEDMSIIYTRLGGGCNRSLCRKFIQSDFDLEILAKRR